MLDVSSEEKRQPTKENYEDLCIIVHSISLNIRAHVSFLQLMFTPCVRVLEIIAGSHKLSCKLKSLHFHKNPSFSWGVMLLIVTLYIMIRISYIEEKNVRIMTFFGTPCNKWNAFE